MAVRRETVKVDMEEILPLIKRFIKDNCSDVPDDAILEYASKTWYLMFDVIRPGKK